MDILCLIGIGTLFGAVAMFCGVRLWDYHKRKEADQKKREADLQKQMQAMTEELHSLREQLKGKQLPYFVKDGLEDIKALENKDAFDLARLRLYAEEFIKTIDQAADRQTQMGAIYTHLRNHTKKFN